MRVENDWELHQFVNSMNVSQDHPATKWSYLICSLSSFLVAILVFLKFGAELDEEHFLGVLLVGPYVFLGLQAKRSRNHVLTRRFILVSTILMAGTCLAFLIQDFFFPSRGGFPGFVLVGLNVILWGAVFVVGIAAWLMLYFCNKRGN